MTEDELKDVGQTVQKLLPKGMAWILVMVPEHTCDSERGCPLETSTNLSTSEDVRCLLTGAAKMFEIGAHAPLTVDPVARMH